MNPVISANQNTFSYLFFTETALKKGWSLIGGKDLVACFNAIGRGEYEEASENFLKGALKLTIIGELIFAYISSSTSSIDVAESMKKCLNGTGKCPYQVIINSPSEHASYLGEVFNKNSTDAYSIGKVFFQHYIDNKETHALRWMVQDCFYSGQQSCLPLTREIFSYYLAQKNEEPPIARQVIYQCIGSKQQACLKDIPEQINALTKEEIDDNKIFPQTTLLSSYTSIAICLSAAHCHSTMKDIARTFFDNPGYLTLMMLAYMNQPSDQTDQIDLQNEIIDRLCELKQYDNLEYLVRPPFSKKGNNRIVCKIFEKLSEACMASKKIFNHVIFEKSRSYKNTCEIDFTSCTKNVDSSESDSISSN